MKGGASARRRTRHTAPDTPVVQPPHSLAGQVGSRREGRGGRKVGARECASVRGQPHRGSPALRALATSWLLATAPPPPPPVNTATNHDQSLNNCACTCLSGGFMLQQVCTHRASSHSRRPRWWRWRRPTALHHQDSPSAAALRRGCFPSTSSAAGAHRCWLALLLPIPLLARRLGRLRSLLGTVVSTQSRRWRRRRRYEPLLAPPPSLPAAPRRSLRCLHGTVRVRGAVSSWTSCTTA